MTASEKMGEVKIYLTLFLQDNSLALWWQMTFPVSQKTKCPTGSPVLFHDFSDPGSEKVKVKRERDSHSGRRQPHSIRNKGDLQGVTVHVYTLQAG